MVPFDRVAQSRWTRSAIGGWVDRSSSPDRESLELATTAGERSVSDIPSRAGDWCRTRRARPDERRSRV